MDGKRSPKELRGPPSAYCYGPPDACLKGLWRLRATSPVPGEVAVLVRSNNVECCRFTALALRMQVLRSALQQLCAPLSQPILGCKVSKRPGAHWQATVMAEAGLTRRRALTKFCLSFSHRWLRWSRNPPPQKGTIREPDGENRPGRTPIVRTNGQWLYIAGVAPLTILPRDRNELR